METALVTIVIPTFNDAPEHIAAAVASARGQTHPHVEIIIVDDGSEVPVKMDGFRVIRTVNGGPAAARNAGISAASGDFVIALDADDRLSPNYAAEAVVVLGQDLEAAAAYPRVQEFGERDGLWWPGAGERVKLEDFAMHSPIAVASAFRRGDWEAVGGFDDSLRIGHEDYEFWIRLLGRRGGYVAALPTAVLHYRIRPASRARTQWAEARANTRSAIKKGASRETLAALLTGAEAHAHRMELELLNCQRDMLNLRSWGYHAGRALRRARRFSLLPKP